MISAYVRGYSDGEWTRESSEKFAEEIVERLEKLDQEISVPGDVDTDALMHEIFSGEERNFFEVLPMRIQWRLMARLTRLTNCKKWMSSACASFLEKLNGVREDDGMFRNDSAEFADVMNYLKRMSIGEKLDALHLCKTLVAHEAHNEQGASNQFVDRTLDRLKLLIESMLSASSNAFMNYAAREVGDVLRDENKTLKKRNKEGRRMEKTRSPSLMGNVLPSHPITLDQDIVKIADDAMMVVDESGLPVSIACVKEGEPAPDAVREGYRTLLKQQERLAKNSSLSTVCETYRSVWVPLHGSMALSRWAAEFPECTMEEWEEIFGDEEISARKRREIRTLKKGFLREKSRILDEVALPFLLSAKQEVLRMESDGWVDVPTSLQEAAREYAREFEDAMTSGRLDHAFEYLDALSVIIKFGEHPKGFISRGYLNGEDVNVFVDYRELGKKEKRELSATTNEYRKTSRMLKEEERTSRERAENMFARRSDVTGRLTEKLQELRREAEERMRPALFQSYASLVKDDSLFPFGAGETNFPLLLRQMHRPAITAYIREDIGIDITALPLRSQVHLLKFLGNATDDVLLTLKQEIKGMVDSAKRDFLDAFFACAEHHEMGGIMLRLAEQKESMPVFKAYAKLAADAERIVEDIMKLQDQVPGKKYPAEHFRRQILKKANQIVRLTEAECAQGRERIAITKDGSAELFEVSLEEICGKNARKLFAETDALRNLSYLVAAIERDDLAELNVETFALTKLHGPVPIAEVVEKPIGNQIREIVQVQFPQDVAEFEMFQNDPSALISYSSCAEELLGFFCARELPNGVRHIDWYSTNPESAVPGLAEATLLSSVRKMGDVPLYAVVAPHVASSTTFIERMKCVATAETTEYSQKYLHVHSFPSEKGRYVGHKLESKQIEDIKGLCDQMPGALRDFECGSDTLGVVRVDFDGRDHRDDVNAGTFDGQIYRLLRDLNAHGEQWVMSRKIPKEGNSKKRQAYYCVFERGKMSEDDARMLREAIEASHG